MGTMEGKIKIKVCGMREEDNIRLLCQLPIDYIGFIFYPHSKRYVGEMPARNVQLVPKTIKRVGVFVDATLDAIKMAFDRYQLDLVQLHGSENPEFCFAIKNIGIPIIKAFAANKSNLSQLQSYQQVCDFLLFDTPTSQHGGSGSKFDWTILQQYDIPLPFFLSGGLSTADVHEIRLFHHPQFYAIDVNSRFEIQPGVKDISLLKSFIEQL